MDRPNGRRDTCRGFGSSIYGTKRRAKIKTHSQIFVYFNSFGFKLRAANQKKQQTNFRGGPMTRSVVCVLVFACALVAVCTTAWAQSTAQISAIFCKSDVGFRISRCSSVPCKYSGAAGSQYHPFAEPMIVISR